MKFKKQRVSCTFFYCKFIEKSVVVKGKFYPDRSAATEKDPVLHLCFTGPTAESVASAVEQIDWVVDKCARESIGNFGPPKVILI